ncbi:MAG: hypothetical protein WBO10_13105 [Pyrinomonadaceae bacterium]
MMKNTRSQTQFALFIGHFIACLFLAAAPNIAFGQDPQPFEVLVVGDSHISGQGLKEENKSYMLVKDLLESDVFGMTRRFNLKVKAHAGSRIKLHPVDRRKIKQTGEDPNKFYDMKANISSPSIRTQIDFAQSEYHDPGSVGLVMLSGCITDVSVGYIVSPFYPKRKLRERIKRFCGGSMFELLEHTAAAFPNAQIVVVGYFPIASQDSDTKAIARYFLKIMSFPSKLSFFFTNLLSRQFIKILRKCIAQRSKMWLSESNREIRGAIARINDGRDKPIAFFVESPITPDQSYGTKRTLLWQVGNNNVPDDETYEERKGVCARVMAEKKYKPYGKFSMRMCELSSVAHPSVEGSKAYAEAIIESLRSNGILISNKASPN